MADSLIDQTLQRINKGYSPGTLRRIQKQRRDWKKMLLLEKRINDMTFASDASGLIRALNEYESFILDTVETFKAQSASLFDMR